MQTLLSYEVGFEAGLRAAARRQKLVRYRQTFAFTGTFAGGTPPGFRGR